MDKEDLQIFMAIVKEESILKAADALYMSPSTVGTRLKNLEAELHVELITRKKGIKKIALTEEGLHFYGTAGKMLELYQECEQLHTGSRDVPLTIATADSYLDNNFVPLYRKLLYGTPPMRLDLQLYPSDMIYTLVSHRAVDMGFALYDVKYTDVIAEPIYEDDIVVIVPQDSPLKGPYIHPDNLDPEKELFIGSRSNRNVGWGEAFNLWHNKWFSYDKEPLLRANLISLISYFLTEGDYWTLMPRTSARGYVKRYNLRMLELAVPSPKRTCYMLKHAQPNPLVQNVMEQFEKELKWYIQKLKEEIRRSAFVHAS